MKVTFQRKLLAASLMAVSAGIAVPAFAQSSDGKTLALEEIVVTARRREESLQSVPLSVNAVTADHDTQVVIGVARGGGDAASTALSQEINISPTIRVAQGTPIRIFVSRDLDFSGVAGASP